MKLPAGSKLSLISYTASYAASVILMAGLFPSQAHAQKIRPLSKGWYRIPYAERINGQQTDLTGVLHDGGNVFENGHNGYDLLGLPRKNWNGSDSAHRIVAMADGRVVEVEDGFNECSSQCLGFLPSPCTPDLRDSPGLGCPCNNKIWIEHPNGEFSAYYHIAFDSAQVVVGQCVVAGEWIANEGDVGSTGTCGGGGSGTCDESPLNRPKRGCEGNMDPSAFATESCADPRCVVHLHFAVSPLHLDSMSPTVIVIPRICTIPGHVILNGQTSVADIGPCNTSCQTNVDLDVDHDYLNTAEVVVAGTALSTSADILVSNSVIGFEAGERVTLNPGFRAVAGSYFRASIGGCYVQDTGCPVVLQNPP